MTQYHFSDADTSTVLDVIPSHHMGALLTLKFKLNLLLCYFDQYLFKMRCGLGSSYKSAYQFNTCCPDRCVLFHHLLEHLWIVVEVLEWEASHNRGHNVCDVSCNLWV